MKKPKFLKVIHIGEVIQAEMKKRQLTEEMLAEKIDDQTKWSVENTFKQKSIKRVKFA